MRGLVLIILCFGLLSGCTSRNVTSFSKYHVGYVPDHVYELKVDRELVHAQGDPQGMFCMVKPSSLKRDWLEPIGLLQAGSRIQIHELRYETNITLSDVDRCVAAYGRIVDGPHAGANVGMAGVSDIVEFPQAMLRSNAMKPDPAFVQKVEAPDGE